MSERARVEGHSSHLARALITVQRALGKAGTDPDTAADAIGSALEEAGIPFHACGPIERELATNDVLRARLWDEASPAMGAASVLRGGEPMTDVEHDPS